MKHTISCYGTSLSADTRGAELCSYTDVHGCERLWEGDPSIWPGHAPVLFPIVGAPVNHQVRFAGQTYPIHKHGFMMMREFTLVEQGNDFLHFSASADDQTLRSYPYAFRLHIQHTLLPQGFSTEFCIQNEDTRPMPYCIGGHPGFRCPMEPGAAFEDYLLRFEKPENGQIAICPDGELIRGHEVLSPLAGGRELPLHHSYFDEKDALIFTSLASRQVDLIHRKSQKGIRFRFDDFDVLGVWTKPGARADYLCLEPWVGLNAYEGESGDFEQKPFVRTVLPGQSHRLVFTATILE